jgi:hypothetical protein
MNFLAVFVFVGAILELTGQEVSTQGRYDYVVSIPDVHGDLDVLLRALWMAHVEMTGKDVEGSFDRFRSVFQNAIKGQSVAPISNNQRVLAIQTGDIIDRGAQSLSCYKAVWVIKSLLGWDLLNLIGNHEVMTMAGQADHYAHSDDVSEFGSLSARRAAFSPGGKIWKRITDEFRFMSKVKMGTTESVLFVHAGVHPKWLNRVSAKIRTEGSIDEINSFLMDELRKNPSSDFLASALSPVWTREMAQDTESVVCGRLLPPIRKNLDIDRIVVGHTPQQTLMTATRCENRIILADVAMSRWMGSGKDGNPSALMFALSDNGNSLERIYNLYWKKGQVVDQVLVQTPKKGDEISVNEL